MLDRDKISVIISHLEYAPPGIAEGLRQMYDEWVKTSAKLDDQNDRMKAYLKSLLNRHEHGLENDILPDHVLDEIQKILEEVTTNKQ